MACCKVIKHPVANGDTKRNVPKPKIASSGIYERGSDFKKQNIGNKYYTVLPANLKLEGYKYSIHNTNYYNSLFTNKNSKAGLYFCDKLKLANRLIYGDRIFEVDIKNDAYIFSPYACEYRSTSLKLVKEIFKLEEIFTPLWIIVK